MRALIGQLVRRGLPVIPVLLAGAREDAIPPLLADAGRADLRGGLADAVLDRLAAALRGERPARGVERTGGQAFEEPETGIRFLWVPKGTFVMGADDLDDDSRPPHEVEISPFWLAETPVTNGQYARFVEATASDAPYSFRQKRFSGQRQPVAGVSWQDAVAFCAWLSARAKREVRLPTEAQWEYAARGSEGRRYPWGKDEPDERLAQFGLGDDGSTADVDAHPAGRGPFGHLDLSGNVWEWCRDVWREDAYRDPARAKRDPEVTAGDVDLRCRRGGSFWNGAENLRPALRRWLHSHWTPAELAREATKRKISRTACRPCSPS